MQKDVHITLHITGKKLLVYGLNLVICLCLVAMAFLVCGLDLINGGDAGGTPHNSPLPKLYSWQEAQAQFGRALTPGQFVSIFKLSGNQKQGNYGADETIAFLEFSSLDDVSYKHFCKTFAGADPLLAGEQNQVVFVGRDGHPVGVRGMAKYNRAYGQGAIAETMLDVEWAHVIAPKARLLVIDVRNMPASVMRQTLAKYHVNVVSNSNAGRLSHIPMFSGNYNWIAANYAFFSSSGDNGAFITSEAGLPQAVIVGGTDLNPYANHFTFEGSQIWPYEGNGGAFLHAAAAPYQRHSMGFWRSVPDVVWFAGYPGVFESLSSKWIVNQGTSLSTPCWAAVWALADEAHRTATGKGLPTDANQVLYRLKQSAPQAFAVVSPPKSMWGLGMPSASFVAAASTFNPATMRTYVNFYPRMMLGCLWAAVTVLLFLGVIGALIWSGKKKSRGGPFRPTRGLSWSVAYFSLNIVTMTVAFFADGFNGLPLSPSAFPFRIVALVAYGAAAFVSMMAVKHWCDRAQHNDWASR